MRRLFKRKASVDVVSGDLPAEVATLIAASSVIPRPSSERVLVQLNGWTPFVHTTDSARVFFRGAFSSLTAEQVDRAVRMLDARVSLCTRMHDEQRDRSDSRPRWSAWRPLKMPGS